MTHHNGTPRPQPLLALALFGAVMAVIARVPWAEIAVAGMIVALVWAAAVVTP